MADGVVLNDTQIRGLIIGAVDREHKASTTVAIASHGETYRQVQPTDKPTPSAAAYTALATLWNPVLTQIYAMPAAQALKGVVPDPQIGTTRIANPTATKGIL